MVTETESTPKALTDNELLMGLEALARRRWFEQFERGHPVDYAYAHCDLVPGATQFDGQHRITVEFNATGRTHYYYREAPFTPQILVEDRDTALWSIGQFRPACERERIPYFLANDERLLAEVRQ